MYKQAVINSLIKLSAKTRQEERDEGIAYTNKRKELKALSDAARESKDWDNYRGTNSKLTKLDNTWSDTHTASQARLSNRGFQNGPMRRRMNGNTAPRMNEHDPSLNVLPGLRGAEVKDKVNKYTREHPSPKQVQALKDQVDQYKQQNDVLTQQQAILADKNRSKGETIANMRKDMNSMSNDMDNMRRNASIGGAVALGSLGAIGGLQGGKWFSDRMKWKGRKALAAQLIGAASVGALGGAGGYYLGREI